MALFSTIEPKSLIKALSKYSWVISMEKELSHFIKNKVWSLVPPPKSLSVIGSKWVFKNRLNKYGEVVKKKNGIILLGVIYHIIYPI